MKLRQLSLKSKRAKPVLNLKHRKPQGQSADMTTFNGLVKKALEVTQELNELGKPAGRKLSARALLRETLALIQSSPERIASLRAAMENRKADFDHSRGALNRMIQFLKGPNWAFAPKEPRRLNFLMTPEATSELILRQYSSVELYCVAIQVAEERHPECFGTNENSGKYMDHLAELTRQQRDLFARIGTALTADDLDIGTPDMKGNSMVSFKLSGGHVPIAPQDSAGERLVNYLIANGNDRT